MLRLLRLHLLRLHLLLLHRLLLHRLLHVHGTLLLRVVHRGRGDRSAGHGGAAVHAHHGTHFANGRDAQADGGARIRGQLRLVAAAVVFVSDVVADDPVLLRDGRAGDDGAGFLRRGAGGGEHHGGEND
jgi:hypothetical protein